MKQTKANEIKIIGNSYKIIKPLFQVNNYLYAQICSLKNNYQVHHAAVVFIFLSQYLYENEEPSQSLKMLAEKLEFSENNQVPHLIFPYFHLKDSYYDKQVSLFFIRDYLVPIKFYQKSKVFSNEQILEILHGGITCLYNLHIREIIHERISLNTCYLVRQRQSGDCKFYLNILDSSYFNEQDSRVSLEQMLFQSEGKCLNLKSSYKDDIESLIYVIVHLISKGKLFTSQRFQIEWITDSQFLRWKTCQFFKQMIKIVPPELEIIIEIYIISKSLNRNERPDYLKLLKKIISTISSLKKTSRRFESGEVNWQSSSESYKKVDKTTASRFSHIQEDDITVQVQQNQKHNVRKPRESGDKRILMYE